MVAPLANILVLPLVPLTMGIGFIAAFSGMFWLGLGRLLGYFAWLPLHYLGYRKAVKAAIWRPNCRQRKLDLDVFILFHFSWPFALVLFKI